MGNRIVVETGRDRRALVADAGWKKISLASLLAGVLVAYGGFAILAGIAGGILEATGADSDITARWGDLGTVAGLVAAGLLFLSYLFGGYVAGRMARRAGALHGALVFLLGVLIVAVVAVVVRQAAGTEAIVDRLRAMGLPTTGDEWSEVGTIAGLASLVAALAGALIGGVLGERWHAKLLARAIDPEIGAEADARRQAAQMAAEAQVRNTSAHARVDNASLRHRDRTLVDEPTGGDRHADRDGDGLRDGDLGRDRDPDVRRTGDRGWHRDEGDWMAPGDRTVDQPLDVSARRDDADDGVATRTTTDAGDTVATRADAGDRRRRSRRRPLR